MVQLLATESVAQAVLVISLVAALGITLGSLKVSGLGLGTAGVLFSGLIAGHVLARTGISLNDQVMEFAREFGLILFVYTIGMQVGPGFFASLRKHGLPLNLMAASVVLMGMLVAVALHYLGHLDVPVIVGLFSGGSTNTPSLAAAEQALKNVPGLPPEALTVPAMAYAVAYPFGIIGIILAMVLMRTIFRIDPGAEAELLTRLRERERPALVTMNLEVRNPNLDGLPLARVPSLAGSDVVISRVLRQGGTPALAGADTVIRSGDVLLAVGAASELEALRLIVGTESTLDVQNVPSAITTKRIIVTQSGVLGKTIDELGLRVRLGVNVTRINRAEIEMPPRALPLQFGDNLVIVGEPAAITQAAAELGNSAHRLNHPQIIPVFVGIALGVLAGSWPLTIPGLPAPVELGLAGGPLIVAILLSRLGHIGPLVWHLPIGANVVLREVGIVLFLSCVGIRSGSGFVATVMHGQGLSWMLSGALITVVPLMTVAVVARLVWKLNYASLCGLLAGSMTDPPALAFATAVIGSDAPIVSYATVYPLVMLLRVLAAQVLVLTLAG